MNILRYGNLTLKIDLDQRGEEIFTEELKDLVRASQSDYRWRFRNGEYLDSLRESKSKGKTTQEKSEDDLKSIVIKSGNKNRKMKP